MAKPTREDAALMMQVMQWGVAAGMKEASQVIMAEDFDPASADPRDDAVVTVLTLGETIGTFVKQDLLSPELVHDLLWVEGMWARVGPAAKKMREQMGEPRLFENFEALAGNA